MHAQWGNAMRAGKRNADQFVEEEEEEEGETYPNAHVNTTNHKPPAPTRVHVPLHAPPYPSPYQSSPYHPPSRYPPYPPPPYQPSPYHLPHYPPPPYAQPSPYYPSPLSQPSPHSQSSPYYPSPLSQPSTHHPYPLPSHLLPSTTTILLPLSLPSATPPSPSSASLPPSLTTPASTLPPSSTTSPLSLSPSSLTSPPNASLPSTNSSPPSSSLPPALTPTAPLPSSNATPLPSSLPSSDTSLPLSTSNGSLPLSDASLSSSNASLPSSNASLSLSSSNASLPSSLPSSNASLPSSDVSSDTSPNVSLPSSDPSPIPPMPPSDPPSDLPSTKKQKISFGFSSTAPPSSRIITGNALRAAKPAAHAKKLANTKSSGIEALKKEIEKTTRHRDPVPVTVPAHAPEPAPEIPAKTLSAEFFEKAQATRAEKEGAKTDMQELQDDMLRQILSAGLRKEISDKLNPSLDDAEESDEGEYAGLFGPDEESADPDKEGDEKGFSKSDIMPEMERFMKQIHLRPYARERTFDGVVGIVDVKGNIFSSDCDVFIHCCNCFHKMSAGIAKEIKRVFPEAYEKDCDTPRGDKRKLGHFSSVLTLVGVTVVNLYAQFAYGNRQRHLDYDALELGLNRLVDVFRAQEVFPKIGTYYMGCFNAGGDIEVVKTIFKSVFTDRAVYVFDQQGK